MAGILDYQGIFYQLGVLSTKDFRDSILGRNLPPPVNETLTQSGLVSKLDDIGRVINVPIFGTGDENIPIHYDEDKKMFPLGTFYRTTQNVNLNPYIPQDDEYVTYNLTIPPNLPKPQPEEYGEKVRGPYPTSYYTDRFELVNVGDKKGVEFPFNVIDTYKGLDFQKESSLALIGGEQLESSIINKISRVEQQTNPENDTTGFITEPLNNPKDNYVSLLRGEPSVPNTLPNDAVGWNEYNSSNKIPGGAPDAQEGVEPTMSTEIRMGSLLERTSLEQVQFAFNLMNRNGYRPSYIDRRLQGTSDEGLNGRYYIGSEKTTNRGNLITTVYDSSEFNTEDETKKTTIEGVGEPFFEQNKFFWTTGGEQNFNEKTLLYKTQQLVNNNQDAVFINQTKKFFKDKKQDRLISRGNALSESLLIDAEANGNYCRVWTVNDRYSYLRAIRNTGLFTSPDGTRGFSSTTGKAKESVLLDNGFPKYHPVKEDSTTTRKKFMFSIENLAWTDNLADLPLSEIGPGDVLSGTKGRIMWFPPYDLQFDENTSTNWTDTTFIGRSEPVYTYNNTSRSASISFKIIVDHPRVINCYRGKSNNLIERFMGGCVTPDDFLESLECSTSQLTQEEVRKKIKRKKQQKAVVLENKTKTQNISFVCKTENAPDQEEFCSPYVPDQTQIDSLITSIKSFVKQQSGTSNKKVKVICKGFAGEQEGDLETPEEVAKGRGEEVRNLVKASVGTTNVSYEVTSQVAGSVTRRVEVTYKNDAENSDSAQPKEEEKENAAGTYDPEEVKLIDSIIIDENQYFDYIDNNYPNYFKTISEKIKYFQPGFHSITPEGLNSRLTFLNQCMRQGPSIYDKGSNIRPQNLSFGRPPICILRIGDFYHTKIKINTLSINYDGGGGIKYDLNPEGIGVQPMIATIQLSIDIIGGSSLTGPINRLQNAVSFNYYANTEIYDARSDYIEKGELKDGLKLGELKKELLPEGGVEKLVKDLKEEGTKKQLEDSESGDDADGNGDNVIVIEPKNSDLSNISVTIRTRDNKPPSEVVVGKKSNPDNKLAWEIDVEGLDNGAETGAKSVTKTIKSINTNALDPQALFNENAILEDLKQQEEIAKQTFKNDQNTANKQTFDNAKQNVKEQEEKIKNDFKGKAKKVKVVAFLTENKSKTKVKQTFTITDEGLT